MRQIDNDGGMVNVTQAAKLLHVSRKRVWALIGEGTLQAVQNPLDRRERLVPVEQVVELLRTVAPELIQRQRITGEDERSRLRRGEGVPGGEWPLPLSDGVACNPDFQSGDHEEYLAAQRDHE